MHVVLQEYFVAELVSVGLLVGPFHHHCEGGKVAQALMILTFLKGRDS